MTIEPTTVKIEDLRFPDIRKDPHVETAVLARSIGRLGQLNPVVVVMDPSPRVLSGRRRVEAAIKLGWSVVEAVVVTTQAEAVDFMRKEHGGDARRPMVASEKARLFMTLSTLPLGISEEDLRRTTGYRRAQSVLLGKAVEPNIGPEAARILMRVIELQDNPEALRDHRFAAKDALAAMDRTGTIDPPYRQLLKVTGYKSRPTPVFRGLGPNSVRTEHTRPVEEQRQALTRLVSTMDNLATAIDYIGTLNPEMPIAEALMYSEALRAGRSRLTSLINSLKRNPKK